MWKTNHSAHDPKRRKKKCGNLAVKKLSALLRGIAKHQGDFYCLNCLHSFATKNKLKSLKKVCENKFFCETVKPSSKDNILQFNQYIKSDKMACIIYADLEFLIKKIDGCANNPEKSLTTKVDEHIPYGYSISTIWTFDSVENKHSLYREGDCMR